MRGHNYRIGNGMPMTNRKYARGTPNVRIARFQTGEARNDYEVRVQLTSKEVAQIRDNALEAARVSANKKMGTLADKGYWLSVRLYPHVVISENKMIATAGADRLQEGMRRAYGKPIGLASRVRIGAVILQIDTMESHLAQAKTALKTASSKLPMPSLIKIEQLEKSS